jgi:hypothetical protein
MRIVRTKIMHESTFGLLVEAALGAEPRLRYRGRYYERIAGRSSAAIYRRSPHGLAWIQDRVEDYEFGFYQALLRNWCGPDGVIRPRTHLLRGPNGAFRPQ